MSANSILLVDDDTELSEMLAEYLQPEGMSITAVSTGTQGLRHAQQEDYDSARSQNQVDQRGPLLRVGFDDLVFQFAASEFHQLLPRAGEPFVHVLAIHFLVQDVDHALVFEHLNTLALPVWKPKQTGAVCMLTY